MAHTPLLPLFRDTSGRTLNPGQGRSYSRGDRCSLRTACDAANTYHYAHSGTCDHSGHAFIGDYTGPLLFLPLREHVVIGCMSQGSEQIL